ELAQPAINVIENISSRRTERDERNIGNRAIIAVDKKTGLPHLRKRLRLPIRRDDPSYRRARRSGRKRRRRGRVRWHRRVGGSRVLKWRFGDAINFDLLIAPVACSEQERQSQKSYRCLLEIHHR